MRAKIVSSSLFLLLCCSAITLPSASADAVKLRGSGASFPFPLYGMWFKAYGKANKDVIIDYQAKGSGAGIKDFTSKTVDFAASDAAMTDAEIASVEAGVQLLPMTAGKIVLSYNVPGAPPALQLSRAAYSNIFLGHITRWNDPSIAKTILEPPCLTHPSPLYVVRIAAAQRLCLPNTSAPSARSGRKGLAQGRTCIGPAVINSLPHPRMTV